MCARTVNADGDPALQIRRAGPRRRSHCGRHKWPPEAPTSRRAAHAVRTLDAPGTWRRSRRRSGATFPRTGDRRFASNERRWR
ncbi:hypothetical protein C791_4682 [Amycolatopsis azurea DSM 43854]|uniref:Uncharacterized protein n=1 Tax=Amycolatopsis azurea DSM 43854 TaxID=1238180 RepID=M2QFM9_9PSEU|nr:hypothetical protein C791_4682 [Amycolatopsis azurea DSM 43854]